MLALASCGENNSNGGNNSSAANFETITYTIVGSLPEGLTYIPSSTQFPNPSFYKDSGLKLRYENMGVSTAIPEFTGSLNVTIDIALTNNEKTAAASTHLFTITALNSSSADCGVAYLDTVEVGTNTVKVDVTKATSLKVVMTGYPKTGEKFNNVNLKSLTIAKA